jgi:hypothetical protein
VRWGELLDALAAVPVPRTAEVEYVLVRPAPVEALSWTVAIDHDEGHRIVLGHRIRVTTA